jgi:hypothetical protein
VTNGTCTDTSECIYYSGIGVFEQKTVEIRCYPNPNKESFIILCTDYGQEFVIYNSLGIKLKSGVIQDENTIVDISYLSPGIYWSYCNGSMIKVLYVE